MGFKIICYCLATLIASSITTDITQATKEPYKQMDMGITDVRLIEEIESELVWFMKVPNRTSLALIVAYCETLMIRYAEDGEYRQKCLNLKVHCQAIQRMTVKSRYQGRQNRMLMDAFYELRQARRAYSHIKRKALWMSNQYDSEVYKSA